MLKKILFILAMLTMGTAMASCSSGGYPMVSQGIQATGNAPWSTTTVAATGPSSTVKITIKNINTPEGSEPAFVGPNGVGSSNLFTVKAGSSVTVIINNQDSGPHTFTIGNLNINESISPLSVTKFKLVISAPGTYSWYCEVPCGGWVMDHTGYMKGSFQVV